MSDDQRFDIDARIETIPHAPGCYLMRNKQGRIIYIGKAKDLKNRVRNYFQPSGDPRPFVKWLPRVLGAIETIITANEKEALILENNLIKKHKPRFNVRLKDDKSFLTLCVDTDHRWPRVKLDRSRNNKEKGRQFGPYHSARAARQTKNIIDKHFMLRTCPDHVLTNRSRPCLQYQIKRCPAPCVFEIDHDQYLQDVDQAIMFLEGRAEELVDQLRDKMLCASDALEFERAARHRDQIEAVEKVLQRQQAVGDHQVDQDAFGYYRKGDRLTVQVLTIRQGRMTGARDFSYTDQEFPDPEILSSFLNLYYNAGNQIPREILLPFDIDDGEVAGFQDLLGELAGHKVYIKSPQRGAKRALVETANKNAEHSFEKEHAHDERVLDLLEKLQRRLHLDNLPRHIECYDVSNLQGRQIVGSRVVFVDAEPDKAQYRRYKMRLQSGQDDFSSLREMLQRRFQRVADAEDDRPDLVVIDGGKGQLNQALVVLEDLGIHDIDVVGLAKARADKTGFADPEITHSSERVFLPGRKNPVLLKANTAERYLMEQLRDEAHRFAITYHKNLRRKDHLRSSLDEIQGVGPRTKRDLLRHFGSLRSIKDASLEALMAVDGIGPSTATAVHDFFHPTDKTDSIP